MAAAEVMVGWTTTATRADADRVARGLVEAGLAACTQVSGPITSVYRWAGQVEAAEEFRVTVKFASTQAGAVAAWLGANHPYDTPQWVALRSDTTTEKYLKWVTNDPT